jgi:hypothetical protein
VERKEELQQRLAVWHGWIETTLQANNTLPADIHLDSLISFLMSLREDMALHIANQQ